MSLSGALSSAISGLAAQSTALSMISDNISNADTTGYKTTSSMFDDLVTASSSATAYSSGGVTVSARANITQQGLLSATTTATNVAIQGSGFFTVTDSLSNGTTYYTRNGAFTTDSSGYLVNNGYYLEGWRTDSTGKIVGSESSSNLQPVNTEVAATSASASTKTTFDLNLPADATANTSASSTPTSGSTFTSSMTVYDSLGNPSSIEVTWTKTSTANEWTASFANPTSTSDTSTSTGSITSGAGPITVDFNTDGSFKSTTPSPATLAVSWNDGASASNITLDLSSVTQKASGESTPAVDTTSITSDGYAFGTLSSIAVGKNGMVDATYSNGQTIPIYQLAVATFTAPDELSAHSDGIYSATVDSGNATLQTSGTNGAGTIYGSELESSTTDTSGQFSNMISAQQAYSAASQVITTVDKMYDTLISAMR
jgi:flagellar hook protein FlgE